MFSLSVDNKDNKLVVVYKDFFDFREAEQLYAEIQESVPKLKKGFIVLADFSSLERMDINAKQSIEKIMELLNKSGVSKVIRVIPDPKKDIGFNIMSLFHYSAGVAIHTYKSYREAEKHLK